MVWHSFIILTSRLKQNESHFGTNLVVLNRDRITRTTPELVPPLLASTPHQREDVCPPPHGLARNKPNTRRIFVGIGFRTWKPFGCVAATRPPRSLLHLHFSCCDTCSVDSPYS
ncbi:hypothetical protein AVEN_68440-1 [Araneus ventricosus]|uniref:Uncharacterized protein n=1 Tax=Araneus ventricosus TaxID=182803 RepID=A0A4Y2VAG7_ARAVE|nr:hypothetical protein AVEN_68440-1 [Araneus ventricosus]